MWHQPNGGKPFDNLQGSQMLEFLQDPSLHLPVDPLVWQLAADWEKRINIHSQHCPNYIPDRCESVLQMSVGLNLSTLSLLLFRSSCCKVLTNLHWGDRWAGTSDAQPGIPTRITGALHPICQTWGVIKVGKHLIQAFNCTPKPSQNANNVKPWNTLAYKI